jgi:hypothetical protein
MAADTSLLHRLFGKPQNDGSFYDNFRIVRPSADKISPARTKTMRLIP